MTEYGVVYPGADRVLVCGTAQRAQSLVSTAQRYPATTGAYMVHREVNYTEWERS